MDLTDPNITVEDLEAELHRRMEYIQDRAALCRLLDFLGPDVLSIELTKRDSRHAITVNVGQFRAAITATASSLLSTLDATHPGYQIDA